MSNRRRVLIAGAGGHGQVVADILLARARHGGGDEPLGYVDDDLRLAGQTFGGIPVLGEIAGAANLEHDAIIVAIGENRVRRQIFQRLVDAGEVLVNAIHPAATLARDVDIGKGVVICARAVVNPAGTIGDDVILNTGCIVEHHSRIADHVHIAPGVCLGGEVHVGSGTLVGIGSTILPGVHVGEGCIVGAGAVVTKDVEDGLVVTGIPARPVRPS